MLHICALLRGCGCFYSARRCRPVRVLIVVVCAASPMQCARARALFQEKPKKCIIYMFSVRAVCTSTYAFERTRACLCLFLWNMRMCFVCIVSRPFVLQSEACRLMILHNTLISFGSERSKQAHARARTLSDLEETNIEWWLK